MFLIIFGGSVCMRVIYLTMFVGTNCSYFNDCSKTWSQSSLMRRITLLLTKVSTSMAHMKSK